jgi:hypothetical protein
MLFMKRKNHLMLLICACACIGAEQIIVAALKNSKPRAEVATRRPTLNERLTALEARVDALEGKEYNTEGVSLETDLKETITPNAPAISDVALPFTLKEMPVIGDTRESETPITKEIIEDISMPATQIVPLDAIASELVETTQAAPLEQEETASI